MDICGQNFIIKDTFDMPVTVPDCIVFPDNKLGTGHGEAKLYIASKERMREFYGEEGFRVRCFVLKQDLLAYMEAMKHEYLHPTQDYRAKGSLADLWQERMKKIDRLPDFIEFDIHDQTQIAGPRGYVNSKDMGYELIREMSLPLVSYISAMKLADAFGTPIYYWKLFADFEAISDKENATVFRYGKKALEEERVKDRKTEKREEEIRQARVGQGSYRQKLLDECPFCPISKITEPSLLIASHIKPWAIADKVERIDPKNGFILSPLYDKLFDQGWITFTNERRVRVSHWLSSENQRKIGVKDGNFIQMLPMDEKRKVYMEYHRRMVFKG